MPCTRAVGVSAVILYADDPAALAAWYEETLGIATRLEPADGNRYGDIEDPADGGVVHLGIYPAPEPLPAGPRAVMVTYRVEDMEATLAGLGRAGVAVEDTVDEPYGRFAYLRDPEGNPVEVFSPARRPEGG